MNRVRERVPADGWIDLQVNGFVGIDFSAPGLDVAGVRRVTQELVKRGTAAYCPTVVTCDPAVYEQNLPVLTRAMAEPDLRPHILGIHLEGPFLSVEGRGAHPIQHLRKPDNALFDRWQSLAQGNVRILTLAPETEGAETVIRHVAGQGVVVSLGHHMADKASIDRAVQAGAVCCTHLGNGIANTLPRHPNPIWTQLAEDRLTGLFITDGHHLPAEFVRVALRAKGIDRFIVTSDAAHIAGLPPGEYTAHGGQVISEPSGRISMKSGWSLAGSSAAMSDCIRWLKTLGVLSEAELQTVARSNPLRLLGYSG